MQATQRNRSATPTNSVSMRRSADTSGSNLSAMSYQYVCEACRQSMGLPADASYHNRIKRERGDFGAGNSSKSKQRPEVFQRDTTGKPLIVGYRLKDHSVGTNSLCVCHCVANGHDPHECTGEDDFRIGGRPGSGFVDSKAKQFGIEPTPEMVASMHEQVAATVRTMLAWLRGNTDDERVAIELDLEQVRYFDQLIQLRDALATSLPEDVVEAVYKSLKPDLKQLAKFRDQKVAHSWPFGGDWLTRVKREGGKRVTYTITPEEVSKHLDLAVKLLSQLSFIPTYANRPTSDNT